jgi:hypothetical protein
VTNLTKDQCLSGIQVVYTRLRTKLSTDFVDN